MQRIHHLLLLSLFAGAAFGQASTELGVWLDHLPYGSGVDVEEANDIVYCATEEGLFFYDNREKTVERLSKVNGLSDVNLTCIEWSERHGFLMVGYENGSIDIVEGERVTAVPDIRQSGNYTGLKRINHIAIRGDIAYICTEFGIVTYDLRRGIVIETLIIGTGGEVIAVTDLAFSDDSIYAATADGLFAADLSTQLALFSNWHLDQKLGAHVNQLTYFNGDLYANKVRPNNGDSIFYKENGDWQYASFINFMGSVRSMTEDKGMLLVSNAFSSQGYDTTGQMRFNLQGGHTNNNDLSPVASAVSSSHNNLWVMDALVGLYQVYRYSGGVHIENITPNGPGSENVVKMYHDGHRLYVAPGSITNVWSPGYNNDGFFLLKDYFWKNYPNSEYEGYKDIVAAISDPQDPEHFYLSSYGNGILEFRDGLYQGILNAETTNGSMQPMDAEGEMHRVGGFSADPDGNIWFSNSLTEHPLGVIRTDGSVETFSLGSAAGSSTALKDVLYTSQDQIWLQTRNHGVVVAYFVNGQLRSRTLSSTEGSGNLPTETVLAFAEDHDGEIWIGTNEGLAVLYSPQNIEEANRNYDAQIIVIDEDEDGAGERVLGAEVINDIEVDGSNKKWFATANSGAFYTSENGKQQLQRFTRENSPLPSNNILDIEVDKVTGMVYFATDQGMVSFQGRATEGVDRHTDVFAYPNPVEPGYEGPILIRGLVTNAQVKITDIEGNIVYETVAEGGQAIWSGTNHAGQRARSGVYLAYITNDEGTATAVTKILIVN